jgi:hypothetical protein
VAFNLLLFALVLAGAAAFVLSPLRDRGQDHGRETGEAREERRRGKSLRDTWLREKHSALLLLRDLEFDYRTGKILESDYQASKAEAERRAVEAMRRLDEIGTKPDEIQQREIGAKRDEIGKKQDAVR